MTKKELTSARACIKKGIEHRQLACKVNAAAAKQKAKRAAVRAKGRAKLEARKPVEPVVEPAHSEAAMAI